MVVAPASVWSSHRNNNEDYSDTSLAPNTLYLVLQHPVPAPAPHVEPCHPVSLHVNTRGEAALVRPQLGDVVFPGLVTRDTAWCGPRDVMNDTRWCEHQPSPTTWQGWEDLLQCLHVALHLCWDQGCWWPTVTLPRPDLAFIPGCHIWPLSAAGVRGRDDRPRALPLVTSPHRNIAQTRELPPPSSGPVFLTQCPHCIFLPVFFSLICGREKDSSSSWLNVSTLNRLRTT